jgi:hypothetical protein
MELFVKWPPTFNCFKMAEELKRRNFSFDNVDESAQHECVCHLETIEFNVYWVRILLFCVCIVVCLLY